MALSKLHLVSYILWQSRYKCFGDKMLFSTEGALFFPAALKILTVPNIYLNAKLSL
jgi:hypothetical protein